jgi:hypothetical protein
LPAAGDVCVTVDEELSALDEAMRRLKVEYDVYFGGGSKKPPNELEWRVQSLLKRFSDSQKLNFAQRFRYNSIAQRYAIFSELWRQKLRIKEEGYRRPEDAALSIQGLRTEQERAAVQALKSGVANARSPEFVVEYAGAETEKDTVRRLYDAMMQAMRSSGEAASSSSFERFLAFIQMKTGQIQRDFQCSSVEYRVEIRDQRARLTARAKA